MFLPVFIDFRDIDMNKGCSYEQGRQPHPFLKASHSLLSEGKSQMISLKNEIISL